MRKALKLAAVLLVVGLGGCEDLFPTEADIEAPDNSTYTYTYTCPATGRVNTIEIPNRLSASCKAAYEYYARTYGCNDANNFAEAERRMAPCR